jgi:hypothetical protein
VREIATFTISVATPRVTSEKRGYRMLISLLQHWPVSQCVNSFECWMTIRLPGMRPNSG